MQLVGYSARNRSRESTPKRDSHKVLSGAKDRSIPGVVSTAR